MIFYQSACDGQTQANTMRFGSKKWLEHALHLFRRQANACIVYYQLHPARLLPG
jgi:hypothetical protein